MTKNELKEAVNRAIEFAKSGKGKTTPELDKCKRDWEELKQNMDDMNIGFHTPCEHKGLNVSFNLEEATKCKTREEALIKFPRKQCPDCGATVYASYEHYLYGDW